MRTNVLSFCAGCVLAAAAAFVLLPRLTGTEAAQNAVHSAEVVGQLRSQIQTLTQQRDICNAKFDRSTILYDQGLFGESKDWIIPADVEPVALGNNRGTFTHYDPKTQTETVHFQPKPQ